MARRKRTQMTCQYCGKVFEMKDSEIKRDNGKYCSVECYGMSKRKRVQVICGTCGKVFESNPCFVDKGLDKYCSVECFGKAHQREKHHNWHGGKIKRICEYCGKTFYIKKSKSEFGAGRYCSPQCCGNARITSIQIPCDFCGKLISITQGENKKFKRHYCSTECQHKSMSEWRRGENNPWFGGHHTEKAREAIANWHRGRLPAHGKVTEYAGTKFRSTWEAKYAQYLDAQGIEWSYELFTFPITYEFDGRVIEGTFTPDFWLWSKQQFSEVKGWWRHDAKEKYEAFVNQYSYSVALLEKSGLKELGVEI